MADSLHLVEFAPVHLHVKVKSNSLCMAEFLMWRLTWNLHALFLRYHRSQDSAVLRCYSKQGGGRVVLSFFSVGYHVEVTDHAASKAADSFGYSRHSRAYIFLLLCYFI